MNPSDSDTDNIFLNEKRSLRAMSFISSSLIDHIILSVNDDKSLPFTSVISYVRISIAIVFPQHEPPKCIFCKFSLSFIYDRLKPGIHLYVICNPSSGRIFHLLALNISVTTFVYLLRGPEGLTRMLQGVRPDSFADGKHFLADRQWIEISHLWMLGLKCLSSDIGAVSFAD